MCRVGDFLFIMVIECFVSFLAMDKHSKYECREVERERMYVYECICITLRVEKEQLHLIIFSVLLWAVATSIKLLLFKAKFVSLLCRQSIHWSVFQSTILLYCVLSPAGNSMHCSSLGFLWAFV